MKMYSIARIGMEDFTTQAVSLDDAMTLFYVLCESGDLWRLGTRRSNRHLVEKLGYSKVHKDNYSKGVYKVIG